MSTKSTDRTDLAAGLLPRRVRGTAEVAMLAVLGVLSAYAYGAMMNMWFWPFTLGADTQLSYVPGAPVLENLHRLIIFSLVTSFVWDLGRAITNVVLIGLLGTPVLATLRRASHKAAFEAPVNFEPGSGSLPDLAAATEVGTASATNP